jgi:hypothetical protein
MSGFGVVMEWWTNFSSGLIAGLVVPLLISFSKFMVGWRERPHGSSAVSAGNYSISAGSIEGNNSFQVNDNRKSKTSNTYNYIEQHYSIRQATASSEDDWGSMILALLLTLGIAMVYVLYAPIFLAVALGLCIGGLIFSLYVVLRSKQIFLDWPEGGTQALLAVVAAAVGTVFVSGALRTGERAGISLEKLTTAAQSGIAENAAVTGVEENLVAQVISVLLAGAGGVSETFGIKGWILLLSQAAAIIIIIQVLILVILKISDWNLLLRFADRSTDNRRVMRRVLRFREGKWSTLFSVLVLSIVACLLTTQMAYSLLENGLPS